MLAAVFKVVVVLIVAGLLFWGLQRLLAVIPVPEPFRTLIWIVAVIVAVLVCLWAIGALFGFSLWSGGPIAP